MKIDFEHLGTIEQGSITLNDFTVFCGKNNSGKTYAMYSIYGLLKVDIPVKFDFVQLIIAELKQNGTYLLNVEELFTTYKEEIINGIEKTFKQFFPMLFGVHPSIVWDAKISLYFTDKKLEDTIKRLKDFKYSSNSLEEVLGTENLILSVEMENGKVEFILKNLKTSDFTLQQIISMRLFNIFFGLPLLHTVFLLPAERTGIDIFFKELFSIRNLLLQQAQNDTGFSQSLLKDVLAARYTEPIKDYLQFLNNISTTKNDKSRYIKYAEIIQNEIVKGKYQIDEFGNIYFIPSDSQNNFLPLPLHFCSSTVKGLFGLIFYLEHLARLGGYLMIDEPELNLHPDNQRQVARVLVQLVNAGLKVIVSTHSDYFVRELNNLIMLEKNFSGATELQKKYGYQDNELLNSKQISAYLFDNNKITPIILDEDEGIIAETFDDVINNLNKSSNEIYYTMQDAKEQID